MYYGFVSITVLICLLQPSVTAFKCTSSEILDTCSDVRYQLDRDGQDTYCSQAITVHPDYGCTFALTFFTTNLQNIIVNIELLDSHLRFSCENDQLQVQNSTDTKVTKCGDWEIRRSKLTNKYQANYVHADILTVFRVTKTFAKYGLKLAVTSYEIYENTPAQFKCQEGLFINGDLECDGNINCPGSQDEENCNLQGNIPPLIPINQTGPSEVTVLSCGSKKNLFIGMNKFHPDYPPAEILILNHNTTGECKVDVVLSNPNYEGFLINIEFLNTTTCPSGLELDLHSTEEVYSPCGQWLLLPEHPENFDRARYSMPVWIKEYQQFFIKVDTNEPLMFRIVVTATMRYDAKTFSSYYELRCNSDVCIDRRLGMDGRINCGPDHENRDEVI